MNPLYSQGVNLSPRGAPCYVCAEPKAFKRYGKVPLCLRCAKTWQMEKAEAPSLGFDHEAIKRMRAVIDEEAAKLPPPSFFTFPYLGGRVMKFWLFVVAMLAAFSLFVWWIATHPVHCVRRAPVPPCGVEQVCVDHPGYACLRYRDACRVEPECVEYGPGASDGGES